MDSSNSLLSSLVQTKSIQRVLAPLATQVSNLIIYNEAYNKGDKCATPRHFATYAENVLHAAEGLVQAASKIARNSTDKELRRQMPSACELITMAGQNLVLVSQRVELEPDRAEIRRSLIRTAKDVLEGTMKVLLVADDAEIRKIMTACQWVMDRISLLSSVKSMKALVACFKGFSESLMILTKLVEQRQKELTNPRQRERLISSMTVLKKAVPMLSTAMQTYVKYQTNNQAGTSRDYVIGQVLTAASDIRDVVQNKYTDEDEEEEPEDIGHFVAKIDQILDLLSAENRTKLDADFEVVVESIVRHSMAVAHLSGEDQRDPVINACHKILKRKTVIEEQMKNVQGNPQFGELRSDFDEECEHLIEEFQELERHVNSAILYQIVEVFSETTGPLERMVKAALSPTKERTPIKERKCVEYLQSYFDDFNSHSDKLYQVANFTAASSTNARRVRVIRVSVKRLEKLDPEIIPATICCRKDRLDQGAVEHLKLLKREWTQELDTLVTNIDDIIDPGLFLNASVQVLKEEVNLVRSLDLLPDLEVVTDATQGIVGKAKRIEQIALRLVDNHEDPIFRNGLLVFVNQLKKAITGVKSALQHLKKDRGDKNAYEILKKRCKILLQCVQQIREGLNEKNHPGILSPLRKNQRSSSNIKKDTVANFEDQENLQTGSVSENNFSPESNMYLSKPVSKEKRSPGSHFMVKPKEELFSTVSTHSHIAKSSTSKNTSLFLGKSKAQRLLKAVTAAAIAGDKTKVNLLCNDLLSLSNDLTEIGNELSGTIEGQSHGLVSSLSEVTGLTPVLLEKCHQVAEKDVGELDALHQVGENWAVQVDDLYSVIIAMVERPHSVARKLADAARMKNSKLLTSEIHHLQDHQKYLQKLVEMASGDVVHHGDIVLVERLQQLKERGNDLENMTATVVTLADVIAHTGGTDELDQLDSVCFEWAAKVCSILNLVSLVHKQSIPHVIMLVHGGSPSGARSSQAEIKKFTEETIRWQEMVNCVVHGLDDQFRSNQVSTAASAMDALTNLMAETVHAAENAPSAITTADCLYAEWKIKMLQYQWACKVQLLKQLIDDLTADVSHFPEKLAKAAILTHCAAGSQKETHLSDFKMASKEIQQAIATISNVALKMAETEEDLDIKATVCQTVNDLARLTPNLTAYARVLMDNPNDQSMHDFSKLKRQWACKAKLLVTAVSSCKRIDTKTAQDVQMALCPNTPQLPTSSPVRGVSFSVDDTQASDLLTSLLGQMSQSLNLTELGNSVKMTPMSRLDTSNHRSTQTVNTDSPASPQLQPTTGYGQQSQKAKFNDQHKGTPSVKVQEKRSSPLGRGSPSFASFLSPQSAANSFSELGKSKPMEVWKQPPQSTEKWSLKSAHQIAAAAKYLQLETAKWEDDSNPIVRVAKQMSEQMFQLSEFTKKQGPLSGKEDMIQISKAIAKNGDAIVQFAKIIAEYCVDKRFSEDLLAYADQVPTISTQLNIIASVKAATPEDRYADKVLVKNAENLMQAVMKTLKAAEAAGVKGLRQPPPDAVDESQAVVLATQWKRKLTSHRRQEASIADMDELGLRMINRNTSGPALQEIFIRR
ncbi:catenin alpha-1 isoform X2 [Lingula anatina]|uniref:Catenin alpha-1 isoform X2 n=1 Tax=Lingula anatina TaxID=7574 RepID=A0A1S3HGL1_LINAN|nr:catenin alpha-1 isoform X2 [Lingula anatina]|eukprot:XP_013384611.1 catenin alpha-1 isoform X2 [Lingula anatina]